MFFDSLRPIYSRPRFKDALKTKKTCASLKRGRLCQKNDVFVLWAVGGAIAHQVILRAASESHELELSQEIQKGKEKMTKIQAKNRVRDVTGSFF